MRIEFDFNSQFNSCFHFSTLLPNKKGIINYLDPNSVKLRFTSCNVFVKVLASCSIVGM